MNNFDRIAGYHKEKSELLSIRNLLLNVEEFRRSGVRMPRGVLLYGAPGVGKTVMAKSIATDGISFVELRAADCTRDDAESYVISAFDEARRKSPAILLIDELDKIAESNSRYLNENNDKVMKVLLQELDGQKDNSGVVVIATCNSYSNLNPALLRAGRFDRMIEISTPSFADRVEIIKHYFSKITLENTVDVDYLAKITVGYSCSQLECVINEAGIMVMQSKSKVIDLSVIQKAMNRIAFKALEGQTVDKSEQWNVAVHEAGHTVAALTLNPSSVTSVSIIPQGKSRGHVKLTYDDDVMLSVDDVETDVTVGVAGAAAEEVILGKRYLGSFTDFKKARVKLMSLIFGIGAYDVGLAGVGQGKLLDSSADEEMVAAGNRIYMEKMRHLYAEACRIIAEKRELTELIARALVEKSTLSSDEILELAESLKRAA